MNRLGKNDTPLEIVDGWHHVPDSNVDRLDLSKSPVPCQSVMRHARPRAPRRCSHWGRGRRTGRTGSRARARSGVAPCAARRSLIAAKAERGTLTATCRPFSLLERRGLEVGHLDHVQLRAGRDLQPRRRHRVVGRPADRRPAHDLVEEGRRPLRVAGRQGDMCQPAMASLLPVSGCARVARTLIIIPYPPGIIEVPRWRHACRGSSLPSDRSRRGC